MSSQPMIASPLRRDFFNLAVDQEVEHPSCRVADEVGADAAVEGAETEAVGGRNLADYAVGCAELWGGNGSCFGRAGVDWGC